MEYITDSIVHSIEKAPNYSWLLGYLGGVFESMGEKEIKQAIEKAHYKFQEEGEKFNRSQKIKPFDGLLENIIPEIKDKFIKGNNIEDANTIGANIEFDNELKKEL